MSWLFFLGTATFFQLTLIRGKSPQVDANTPFSIQDTGSFYVIKAPTGITLTWDKGTRVYLKLGTEHKGKVRKDTWLCHSLSSKSANGPKTKSSQIGVGIVRLSHKQDCQAYAF